MRTSNPRASTVALTITCALAVTGSGVCAADDKPKPLEVAVVFNTPSAFWLTVRHGGNKAETDFNVKISYRTPATGTMEEQNRIIQSLIADRADVIIISPIDPETQRQVLNAAAARSVLITIDADAPNSLRRAFIGNDEVAGGKKIAKLIRKAMPDGGKIALFIGLKDTALAKQRIEAIQKALAGSKVSVLGVFEDNLDGVRARAVVENVLARHPDLDGLVGLFSYNGPAILRVVKAADRAGKLHIFAYDEDERTLQGIRDGQIHGTMVLTPDKWVYEAARIGSKLARGAKVDLPEDKVIAVPPMVVTKDNVEQFSEWLKKARSPDESETDKKPE